MESVEINPELAAALVRAQKRATAIGKDGKNDFHGYRYVTAEKMIHAVTAAMNVEGIGFMRTSVSIDGEWSSVTVQGKRGDVAYPIVNITSQYLVFDTAGHGLTLSNTLPAVVESGRPPDKAVLASATESISYALRDVMMVARGHDEIDVSGRVDDPSVEPRHPQSVAGVPTKAPQQSTKSDATAWGFANLPPLWAKIAETYDSAGFGDAIDAIDSHEAVDGHRSDPPVLSALATACLAAAALFRGDRIAKIAEAKAAFDAGTIDLPPELLKHRGKLAPQVYAVIEAVGS